MKNKKLVLIGAGSAMFTRGLLMDLIEKVKMTKEKWHMALVDVDPTALEPMRILCEKMVMASGSDIVISYSTDRCEVLSNADYVITTIGVGGRRAWEQDVLIPRKYGIYQPVGDSVAPGGISRAMRMIPAMLDITKDIIKYCPNAYFFNYANPMTSICRAIRKATGFPVIGLCHGVKNGEKRIARFAGLDTKKISSYALGINHMVFIHDLRYDGMDAWPEVKRKLKELNVSKAYDSVEIGPLSRDFIETYGAYPASDDRHYSEFTQGNLHKNGYFGKTLGIDAYSFEKTIGSGDSIYDETKELAYSDDSLDESFFKRSEGEHEQLMDIIHSIEHDERKVFSVNVPNNSAFQDLPGYALLEMPTAATARGFMQLKIDKFDHLLTGILAKHIEICEITVEAALNGDRRLFSEAILHGGYTDDRSMVNSMVEELLEAQKKFLPQF